MRCHLGTLPRSRVDTSGRGQWDRREHGRNDLEKDKQLEGQGEEKSLRNSQGQGKRNSAWVNVKFPGLTHQNKVI